MSFAVPRSIALLLLGALAGTACGTPPTGTASSPTITMNGGGDNSSSTAAAMAKATEPRMADPTGARPISPNEAPKPFANIGMNGAPPPAPASSSDPSSSKSMMRDRPQKISARHILIQWMGAEHAAPSVVRSKEQAYNVAKDVLRRARAHEDFARLAVEYSDEPNAAQRGGSLGRFGHGAMVPEFEAAAFKLEVGEISDIVESPFGYHVIQRTE